MSSGTHCPLPEDNLGLARVGKETIDVVLHRVRGRAERSVLIPTERTNGRSLRAVQYDPRF